MKKQIGILIFMLVGVMFAPIVFASEVGGVLSTLNLQSPGMNGTVNNCNPLTVEHGTVAPYPSCAITCGDGYTLNGTTCVVSETVEVCDPASVTNGTVAPYPSCTITCDSGYSLSGTACVVIYSGGGGGGGGSPTPPASVVGDLSGDGVVNFSDFNTLMINWGATGSNVADLNNDGIVDFFDFNTLMINWTK